jgi:predicted DNA-binding transcriptional regulator AlpA
MDLLGTNDVAELLGVPRQRAHEIVNRKGFPDPADTVNARTKVWDRAEVVEWAVEHKYDITPAPRP